MAKTKETLTTTTPAAGETAAPLKTGAVGKTDPAASSGTQEARSRFNSALEEAKAGAAALRGEANVRAEAARENARTKGDDLVNEARGNAEKYSELAKTKAGEIAVDAKTATSDGIATLGQTVAERAVDIDARFGEQYGDYARKASRSLAETSAKLDAKSVEEIGEDARQFVRQSPGMAVGMAAVAGYMFARLFGGSRR